MTRKRTYTEEQPKRCRVSSFRYAIGYSPDQGRTQWIVAARSMQTLRKAWYAIEGQELEFNPEDAVEIITRKKRNMPNPRLVKVG